MVIDVVIRYQQSTKSIYDGPIEVEVVHSFQPTNLYLKAINENFITRKVHQVMSVIFSHKINGIKLVFHADGYVVLNKEEGSLKFVIDNSYCFINDMFDANYEAESLYPIEVFEKFTVVELPK